MSSQKTRTDKKESGAKRHSASQKKPSQVNAGTQAELLRLEQAIEDPSAATPADLLALQSRHGNQAVSSLIQTKLRVGPAGDSFEQEADRVADRAMDRPTQSAAVQRQADTEEEEIQAKPLATSITPLVQRTEADEEEELQAARTAQSPEEGFEASASIEQRLASLRGSGSPLPDQLRADMESRFGAGFGAVRVHTDAEADALNRDLRAKAFTHRTDIYFSSGEYDAESEKGKHLLAHELTHVVQQTGGGTERSSAGGSVGRGRQVAQSTGGEPAVQRFLPRLPEWLRRLQAKGRQKAAAQQQGEPAAQQQGEPAAQQQGEPASGLRSAGKLGPEGMMPPLPEVPQQGEDAARQQQGGDAAQKQDGDAAQKQGESYSDLRRAGVWGPEGMMPPLPEVPQQGGDAAQKQDGDAAQKQGKSYSDLRRAGVWGPEGRLDDSQDAPQQGEDAAKQQQPTQAPANGAGSLGVSKALQQIGSKAQAKEGDGALQISKPEAKPGQEMKGMGPDLWAQKLMSQHNIDPKDWAMLGKEQQAKVVSDMTGGNSKQAKRTLGKAQAEREGKAPGAFQTWKAGWGAFFKETIPAKLSAMTPTSTSRAQQRAVANRRKALGGQAPGQQPAKSNIGTIEKFLSERKAAKAEEEAKAKAAAAPTAVAPAAGGGGAASDALMQIGRLQVKVEQLEKTVEELKRP